MIEQISKLLNGATILSEWIGDGAHPVHTGLAQSRADTCAACVKNVRGHWWNQSTDKLADTIRSYIEVKNHIGLRVFGEEKLGTCDVCQCNLPLKVHVPIVHIHAHTSDDTISKFPSNCWITKELKP